MPPVKIPLSNLTEGVSTRPSPERPIGSLASAINTSMRRIRGLEKRAGTRLIKAPTADYSLDVTTPTNGKFFHWIDRDEDEKFLVIVDPLNTGLDRIEIFTLVQRGNGSGGAGHEAPGEKMTVDSTTSGGDDPLDYLALGSQSARHRFRALTVADTTLIANRDVNVALTGSAITYEKADTSEIRDTSNSNNVASWNNLPQPPGGTVAAGVTTSDYIFYTRDDDLGWPAGWYRASSSTQPPWYERIRTEPENSEIDHTSWPVRLNFDGADFELAFPEWNPRYSGDSFTNPGPQLASGPSAPHRIRDMCYFQGRLWLGGYEFIDSSQTGDVFNFWNNSYVGITDADPVNVSLQSDAVTTIDWIIPFDGGIVALTRGSRQFEIKAQGAMSPSTVAIIPTTAYSTVNYCPPAKLGNQLYFLTEQNGAMQVYEYIFQEDRSANVAYLASEGIEGYIPSRVWTCKTSNQNDMLFLLVNIQNRSIYVNQMEWAGGKNSQRAWMRWDHADVIMDCQVMGSLLYLVIRRNNKLYLETIDIDLPSDDDDGLTPTEVNGYAGSGDMGFALRLDSRASYQGVYNSGTNTTTWTVPYKDPNLDTVVLGQMWDCDFEFPTGSFHKQRRKGKILTSTANGGTVTFDSSGSDTVITVPGNFATNGNGDDAPVWIGASYEMRGRLNEQFVRGEDGSAMAGLVQFKYLMLRLAETGNIKVEVTPQGRDTLTHEYVKDLVGQASLGEGLDFLDYDEWGMVVMGSAYNTRIEIVNDSPYPSRVVGGEFRATFVPSRKDPTRR